MKRKSKVQFIIIVLFVIASILACVMLMLAIYENASAGNLPEGMEYPTINRTTTCFGSNITVSQWLIDPMFGDEWASSHTITYLQNAQLNTEDGDMSPAYGTADWLLDHSAINQVTIEITSELHHNETLAQVYVETISFTSDPSCANTGNVNDVTLTPVSVAHSGMAVWNATHMGEQLAQIGIVLYEDGSWGCDEVVDVTAAGSLFADALDTICHDKAEAFNSNATYMPVVVK